LRWAAIFEMQLDKDEVAGLHFNAVEN